MPTWWECFNNVLHFFKHESCGHCVPCRLGIAQNVKLMDRVASSKGSKEDVDKMLKISEVMKDTSFCPLGQSLHLPISSSLKYFREEIGAHIQ